MPTLTVTNQTRSNIAIGGSVGVLSPSEVLVLELQIHELEEISNQLTTLRLANLISFVITSNSSIADDAIEGVTLEQMTSYVEDAIDSIPAGGGGGGPTFIVGNSVAGDTESDCTHLDDGTGAALRTALTDASAGNGSIVWVRRGTYNIGGSTGLTTIPSNVLVTGEGIGTILALPQSGQMASLLLQSGAKMQNLSVKHIGVPNGALTDGVSNRFIEMASGSLARNVHFECRADAGSVANYPGFWSLIRMSGDHAKLDGCYLSTYSSTALGSGSEAICAMAVGINNEILNCVFGTFGALNLLDVAVELGEGSGNQLRGCSIYNSRNYGVRFVGVGGTVDRTKIQDCNIFVQSGVGAGTLFIGSTTFNELRILGCNITCYASATAGINIQAPNAGEDINNLAIQGCALRGSGAGTGIIINETSGGITNVSESLNSVTNFSTARSGSISGPTVSVGNY